MSPGNILSLKHDYVSSLAKLLIYISFLSIGVLYFFPYTYYYFFNFVFYIDIFTKYASYLLFLTVIIFFLLVLNGKITHSSSNSPRSSFTEFEIILLFLFSVLGIFGMIISNDFISLYLFLELQSLGLYLLASSTKKLESSVESGLKYFILGAFASSLFLFGLSICYGFLGITSFDGLAVYFHSVTTILSTEVSLVTIGLLFILFGFFFKLAIFPFHQWLPDIYEGADFIIVIFFAVVSKLSIIVFFAKFFLVLGSDLYMFFSPIIMFCVIGSIILGSVSALFQTKVRKLLAFSSIVNMGYVVLVLFLNSSFSIPLGILTYINYIACLFPLMSFFYLFSPHIKKGYSISNIKELDGLDILTSYFRKDIAVSLSIVIIVFSLFGLPPFLGFFSKFYLLLLLVSQGYFFLIGIILLVTLVSVFYYLRVLNYTYFNLNKFGPLGFVGLSVGVAYTIVICLGLVSLFIVNPNFLLTLSLDTGLLSYI